MPDERSLCRDGSGVVFVRSTWRRMPLQGRCSTITRLRFTLLRLQARWPFRNNYARSLRRMAGSIAYVISVRDGGAVAFFGSMSARSDGLSYRVPADGGRCRRCGGSMAELPEAAVKFQDGSR